MAAVIPRIGAACDKKIGGVVSHGTKKSGCGGMPQPDCKELPCVYRNKFLPWFSSSIFICCMAI